jgi:hypothetical protein
MHPKPHHALTHAAAFAQSYHLQTLLCTHATNPCAVQETRCVNITQSIASWPSTKHTEFTHKAYKAGLSDSIQQHSLQHLAGTGINSLAECKLTNTTSISPSELWAQVLQMPSVPGWTAAHVDHQTTPQQWPVPCIWWVPASLSLE